MPLFLHPKSIEIPLKIGSPSYHYLKSILNTGEIVPFKMSDKKGKIILDEPFVKVVKELNGVFYCEIYKKNR